MRVAGANVEVPALVDEHRAKSQWSDLGWMMSHARDEGFEEQTTGEWWYQQVQKRAVDEEISEIILLVHIVLLIPVGSVINERAFSAMNFLKSDLRNRLDELHLNTCMRVKRCRFDLKSFPIEAAIVGWRQMKERRGELLQDE